LKAKQKEEMAPFHEKLEKMEAWLLREMSDNNVDSFKSDAGTAYKSTDVRAKVTDREALFDFIRETNAFDMLTAAVSKVEVQAYAEEHKKLPPGVEISGNIRVNVRRSS
jgi:hypothetical protein